MSHEAREAMIRRLHRQFAEMAQDDTEETPGYQPRQLADRRPFYMDDQAKTLAGLAKIEEEETS